MTLNLPQPFANGKIYECSWSINPSRNDFKLHKLVARFSRKNIGFYSSVASIAWLNIILRLSTICISYQHNSAIIDSLIPKPPFATPSLNRTKSAGLQLPTQWNLDQVKVESWLLFFCCVLAVGKQENLYSSVFE